MSPLNGTGTLARLALRRDRVRLPLWIAGLAALLTAQGAGNVETYADAEERTAAATVLAANPGLRLLRGPAADTSIGALVMSDAYWLLAVLAAVMSALTVIRHTRQDEESGRTELVGATPVGVHATLTAALTVTALANTALFVLLTTGLLVNGLPVAGSVAAGASIAVTGVCFGALAAVAAQLSTYARTATALTVAAIGAAYLLRAAGDAAGEIDPSGTTASVAWPSWSSPIGWGQLVRPFAEDRWWVLGVPATFAGICAAVAFSLNGRRDFGLGVIPARSGPADAAAALSSPLGLATRLHRGTLLGWAAAVTVAGAVFGSLGREVDELASNADLIETLSRLGGSADALSDTYFAAIMALFGSVITGYPLQILLRMRTEEADGRLEPVLTTAVDRRAWMGGHLLWAAAGTLVLLVVTGVAAGVADAAAGGTPQIGVLTAAAAVQAPAVLAVAGVAAAAFGLVPRHTGAIAWTALVAALLLGPVGDIFDLPHAARDLSPFSHVPGLPAADPAIAPLAVLLATAAALTTLGTTTFNRRDLTPHG